IGQWERLYEDDVGQKYLEVLQIDEDGTYVKHGSGGFNDRGQYSVRGDSIDFVSGLQERYSRKTDAHFSGDDQMQLVIQPFGLKEDWVRSERLPNYALQKTDFGSLPAKLPDLMKAVYAGTAQMWQPDAVPTVMEIEEVQDGFYELALRFYSPSRDEVLIFQITPYQTSTLIADGSRAVQSPLAATFLDLPDLLEAAFQDSPLGPLKRARIVTYDNFGPVWTGNFAGRQGFQFSANTGEIIQGDITGYIADYEADWAKASELWRNIIEQFSAKPEEDLYSPPIIFFSPDACKQAGHEWQYGHCNN
ncbi:MAG: hypothetical protein AAF530_13995, partial [Pseudomonadota bacterium]